MEAQETHQPPVLDGSRTSIRLNILDLEVTLETILVPQMPFPFPSTRLKCHPLHVFLGVTSGSLVPPSHPGHPLIFPTAVHLLIFSFLFLVRTGWLAFYPQDLAELQAPVDTLSMSI